jgi:hypothetical protein
MIDTCRTGTANSILIELYKVMRCLEISICYAEKLCDEIDLMCHKEYNNIDRGTGKTDLEVHGYLLKTQPMIGMACTTCRYPCGPQKGSNGVGSIVRFGGPSPIGRDEHSGSIRQRVRIF